MASKRPESTGLALFRLKQTIGEASGLAPVQSERLLNTLDADAACWVVHDEEPIATAVSILSVRNDTFSVVPIRLDTKRSVRTTDAESVFVHNGIVHVLGSAFVGRKGTVDPRRAFLATFEEDGVSFSRRKRRTGSVHATVEVLGLELVAAANAALERSGIEIAAPAKPARRAAKKAGLPGGVPINIEGSCANPDGTVTLGLRSPVAASGDPILLRLKGDLTAGVQSVHDATVGVLGLGARADEPVGIRDLAFCEGRLHMIAAHSDAAMTAGRRRRAPSRHVSVDADGGDLEVHREFGSRSRVEGLARPDGLQNHRSGGWWYVVDDEKCVVVLSA